MKFKSGLTIASNIINIVIFFYFVAVLFKLVSLDMIGLLISVFGILISLIANIVENLEWEKILKK